jgi:hypothetical protein
MVLLWRVPMYIKDHPMPMFILDVILSALMIGVLVYIVIATTPPESIRMVSHVTKKSR